jgi:peptidyl-prolyl cis-trans isomerase D
MLKTLRQGAIENPWFYRIIMGVIGIAFIITMGWGFGGFGSRSDNVVAKVDKAEITLVDYNRLYQNLYQNYRDRYPDSEKIDENMFKQAAIDQLVNRQLWLKAARELRISVSNQELTESISNIPVFQKGGSEGKPGTFDVERYRQVLSRAHLNPESFEKSQREDLMIDKVKKLVQDSVQLSQKEIEEARKNAPQNQDPERAVSDALYLKRQKALLAFSTNLKSHSKIEIKQELL